MNTKILSRKNTTHGYLSGVTRPSSKGTTQNTTPINAGSKKLKASKKKEKKTKKIIEHAMDIQDFEHQPDEILRPVEFTPSNNNDSMIYSPLKYNQSDISSYHRKKKESERDI